MTAGSNSKSLRESFDPKALAALEGLDLKARYVMEGFLNGLHDSPFHGFSVEFSDYREYQPGDDLKRVDWRLLGRSDKLYVKRYMQETNVRFYLVCDTSASMLYQGADAWGSKLDCARILSAALTWFLLKQNDAAGLISLSGSESAPGFIRPSQRASQLGLLLHHLEELEGCGGACLSRLLAHTSRLVTQRSVILFFSDFLEPSDEVANGLKQLRFHGHEVILFQVLDKDEIEFPFEEARLFEDLETGLRRAISPSMVREKYLERFGAFMKAHRDLFQSLEMPHCVVRTDENPCRALAMFLSERKRLQ